MRKYRVPWGTILVSHSTVDPYSVDFHILSQILQFSSVLIDFHIFIQWTIEGEAPSEGRPKATPPPLVEAAEGHLLCVGCEHWAYLSVEMQDMCLVESQDICLVETQDMCCVDNRKSKETPYQHRTNSVPTSYLRWYKVGTKLYKGGTKLVQSGTKWYKVGTKLVQSEAKFNWK